MIRIEDAVERVPEFATISGMFLAPLAEASRSAGVCLPSARGRYVPFRFYPLREHVALLVETCQRTYAQTPLRLALRKLGRGAPRALLTSMLGKVLLGSAEGTHAVLRAMVNAYPVNLRPCNAKLVEAGDRYAIVHLQDVHYFLDSHHVGAFEAALRYAGVEGRVRVHGMTETEAEFLCEW